MMTVKVECACGQRFAFDVEPGAAALAAPVACPSCGADATAKANAIISQQTKVRVSAPGPAPSVRLAASASPRSAPAPGASQAALRVAATATTVEDAPSTPGHRHVDKTRAENEARAKILWGDDPKEVANFLRSQGLSFAESNRMVQALQIERAATIRKEGVKKIFIGSGLICVPIFAFAASAAAGRFPVRPLALTVFAGFYGIWTLITGLFKVLAPKSEAGDAFE